MSFTINVFNFDKPLVAIANLFKLNLWFGGKSSRKHIVAKRFSQLLAGHKLTEAQFLKLIPDDWNWSVATVSDEEALLRAITPQKITHIAAIFGVNSNWLEGSCDRIYDWLHGYKRLDWFIEQIEDKGWCGEDLMMTVLAVGYKEGDKSSLNQFTIILSHPIAEWDHGETVIYRHECFDAGPLPWDHQPARVNALQLAKWFHCKANRYGWIPIVPCTYKEIEAIVNGKLFPGRKVPRGRGGYDHFEDRLEDFIDMTAF